MLKVALKVPTALGVNVILNVHEELAGTLGWHVLVWAKSFWPLQATLLMASAVDPAFWKVKIFGVLVWPTVVFGKVHVVGVTFTAVPCPLINSPCFSSVMFP
jgi:hypothetical protein